MSHDKIRKTTPGEDLAVKCEKCGHWNWVTASVSLSVDASDITTTTKFVPSAIKGAITRLR